MEAEEIERFFGVSPRVFAEIIEGSSAYGSADHGIEHWKRVSRNAQYLLELEAGAEARRDLLPYVQAFALMHDIMREVDGECQDHGPDAAKAFGQCWTGYFEEWSLGARGIALLTYALCMHTSLQPAGHRRTGSLSLLVEICLDADRLDFGRIGERPEARFMFTDTARKLAWENCVYGFDIPELRRWGAANGLETEQYEG